MKVIKFSLGSAAALILSLFASTAFAQAVPVISNLSSTPSTTSAIIEWDTDIPATSQVGYGTSSSTSPYDNQSDFDSALVTSHSVTLGDLTPDTTYNFAVTSMGSTSTSSESTSTETVTSDNFTFTTLSEGEEVPTSTPTSTPTTTPSEPSDLDNLIDELQDLKNSFPSFANQIQNVIDQLLGNGTSTPPTTGTGHIDQDGQTVSAGSHIDFVGHGFGQEETVLVVRGGVPIGSAHADGGGNFSTGSINVPPTPNTYTYTFTGQTSDIVGVAVITVE